MEQSLEAWQCLRVRRIFQADIPEPARMKWVATKTTLASRAVDGGFPKPEWDQLKDDKYKSLGLVQFWFRFGSGLV